MTTPHAAEQLELPTSLVEATTLQEEVARLRMSVKASRESHAVYEKEFWGLRGENKTLKSELAQAKLDLLFAQTRILLMEREAAQSPTRGATELPPWLDSSLRALIGIAHPDRWQHQPAETLAHEITVALNAWRTRLGEGHP